ncbi:hypothetical protein T440DRAFT_516568 [Plenodomus tracheiphilus IPT5]|uniref:Uncharacterized protein n=1 Tax=Plenodomus tracheiphilus IPT5 TaxID=1408161 RepID=A0A6A7B9V0_9PLEO|nr:hypothetical protein T440DRAFT_516568 [Plenodomus tracheiphilus IPT5]
MAPHKRFRFPSHLGEEGQTSWLDIFPVHRRPSSSRAVSHTSSTASSYATAPDPTKVTRIEALRATLANIKDSIDIRTFDYNLVINHGLFCRSCSRVAQPGTCGPTCALLAPPIGSLEPWFSQTWYEECKANKAIYHANIVLLMLQGSRPILARSSNGKRRPSGSNFKQDWSFEGAGGKGSTSEDVAPDDVSGHFPSSSIITIDSDCSMMMFGENSQK